MKISIEDYTDKKLIWLTVNCSNLDEILLREKLYISILADLLIDCSIKMITISPQDNSLAYGIIPNFTKTLKGKSFLINSVDNCTLDLIERVVLSEEFGRSLLVLVEKSDDLSDIELTEIATLIKDKSSNLLDKVFFCEDDGDSLCIYKAEIEMPRLLPILKPFTTDITIEKK